MVPQCSIDLSADKEFFKVGISLLQFPLSNHVLHCKRIYAERSKFWKSQRYNKWKRRYVNKGPFIVTLWYHDFKFHTDFTQNSFRGCQLAYKNHQLVFSRFIYLSFFPADRDLCSFKTSGSTISWGDQIETIIIIIVVQRGNTGTWQMTPFSSIKSPTLRSTTVSLVAPVFPSVNSRVRR